MIIDSKTISACATFTIEKDGMYRGRVMIGENPVTDWTTWEKMYRGGTYTVVASGYYPGMRAVLELMGSGDCCCKKECKCC